MNIWRVLEIEETRDKEIIKDAYRRKVVSVNPEEDQKGFMELRKAYEQALEWADKKPDIKENEETEWPDTPIGNWIAKADALYKDIKSRGDVLKWQELLEEDICFSLETKTEVRDELLHYFMENCFLPQKIWKLLDEKFSLKEVKEELYEKFPVNYVNNGIIGNIENEEFIKIEYLESRGGVKYDEYLNLCYQLNRAVLQEDVEKAEELFEKLEELKVYHPYEDVFRARYFLNTDKLKEAEKLIEDLKDKYPDDAEVLRLIGDFFYMGKEYESAKENYEKILLQYPDYYDILIVMGHVCFMLKEYKQAKKYYNDAYDIHKTNFLGENMMNCIAELQKEYRIEWERNPQNIENAIELARTYYQQGIFDESFEILKQIQSDNENHLEYVHLMGCNYIYTNEPAKALPYLRQWIEGTEVLEDDGTEKTNKAMERLCASYQCMAQALIMLKRYEEAEEYLEKALKTNYQVIDTYEEKVRLCLEKKEYEEAISMCDFIFERDAGSITGHALKAEALTELDYPRDAAEEWEACIRIEPNNLNFYIKKIEILFYMGEQEEIKEVLTFLEENGAVSERITMWKAIMKGEYGDWNEALKSFSKLIEKAETDKKGECHEFAEEIYFETARIYLTRELEKAEEYIDKALKVKPDYVKALHYKGFICWKEQKYEEAIDNFKKVLEEKPNHFNANRFLGEVYEEQGQYEKAIEYYTYQLELAPDAYVYLSRGWCLTALSRFDEARNDYSKSLSLDEDDARTYRGLALTYTKEEKEEKAVELFKTAIEKDTESDMIWTYRELSRTYQRMGEHEKAAEILMECIEKYNEASDEERLARVYITMGQYEKALFYYNKYSGKSKENKEHILVEMLHCKMFMNQKKEVFKMLRDNNAVFSEYSNRFEIEKCNIDYLFLYSATVYPIKKGWQTLLKMYLKKCENIGDGEDIILIRHQIDLRTSKKDKVKIKHKKLKRVVECMEKEMENTPYDKNKSENRRLCELAALEMGRGDYAKAIEYADTAIANRKCYTCDFCRCIEAYFIKAIALEVQGNIQEALKYYEEAVKMGATDIQYRLEYDRIRKKCSDEEAY